MSVLLPYVIIGVTAGSVYALAGVGLVLTYRTSGIFNFGYGALATAAAYIFYALHVQHGVAWPIAAFISIVVFGVILGFLFEPYARVLSQATLTMQVVGTVGLTLVVQSVCIILYGEESQLFPPFLPQSSFSVGGANVSVAQAITVALVLVLTGTFYVFLRRARLGVALRGVVDNSDLLDLAGTNPRRVRRVAWIIGSMFAAMSGVLLAPSINLDAVTLTMLVVQAFGAAAIGRFSSLPLTYVGGLVIGVVASLLAKYVSASSTILAGIPASLPFIVLFAAMLFMPKRWLASRLRPVPDRARWRPPVGVQIAGSVLLFVFLAFVPQFVGYRLSAWTSMLAIALMMLSLGLLVKNSGQVSLATMGFAAIGAAGFSHLASGAGVPWLPSLLLAGVIALPIGALLAIPAIRLGGIYLVLATFGFSFMLPNMFYSSNLMFGFAGVTMPGPSLGFLTSNPTKALYFASLAIFVVATVALLTINRTRLGRLLSAMADSDLALVTSGTNVATTRVLVFCMSAFLAAIGGALYGMTTGSLVTGDDFPPTNSLILLALVVITAGEAPWYAAIAAAGFVVLPTYISGDNTLNYLTILFGVSAILVSLFGVAELPAWITNTVDRLGSVGWARRRRLGVAQTETARRRVEPGVLTVSDLEVRFGGLKAVDGLSLRAPTGRITGLIGPNGAGKTTTFNVCCGITAPTRGHIVVDDRDLTRTRADGRARAGIGRTFQRMQLFESLTVAQNVAIGREASLAGINPVRHAVGRRTDRATIDASVAEALELCGIADLATVTAGALPTGQQRLVELARCLAGPFRFLLLDEPSSGLDQIETRRFGEILWRVVRDRAVGILLVEHDMTLVMDVCEHIYVLDFGKLIAEGSPAEVGSSAVVKAAYLGSDDLAEVQLEGIE